MIATLLTLPAHATFNLSNTLGDGMVLQRAPHSAVVWGFAEAPTSTITATFGSQKLTAAVGSDGVWRMKLPPTPATTKPTTLVFTDGASTVVLADVLFGDVFLCSGQSNMQYTPRSMAGMNNMTAEISAADDYAATVRFFSARGWGSNPRLAG